MKKQRTFAQPQPGVEPDHIAVSVSPRLGLRAEGQPLPCATRAALEPRFGHDFSQVRVHTDEQAAQAATALNARAFAAGPDIAFGAGQYAPGTPTGDQLIAHELTHVVQQPNTPDAMGMPVSQPGQAAEREAAQVAGRVTNGAPAGMIAPAAPALYRQELNDAAGVPTWSDSGHLIGNPPVRDPQHPPNVNIVEDVAVYNERRAIAEAALATQRTRAEAMLDPQGQVTDFRYWFAKVYSFVTEGELEHASSNTFYYPSYVMASVAFFEQIYNDNFNAFNAQGPVEAHWKAAFEKAAKEKQLTDLMYEQMMQPSYTDDGGGAALAAIMQNVMGAVESLVASMQAHIRYDLPRAEAWVFNSYYRQFENAKLGDFRPDFMSMAGVFDNAARRMNDEMAERLHVPVGLMPQLMQDTSMRHMFDADMATERADTWRRAEELVDNNLAGENPYQMANGGVSGDVTAGDHQSGLQQLPDEELRPTMEHSAPVLDDDAVCDAVRTMSDAEIAALPAVQRVRMIRGLFNGATVGEDETIILKILDASKGSDLVPIIDGADAWDVLYAIDGDNAKKLREFFRDNYYERTAQNTALRLIRKCIDGETAEWEEEMVIDLLEKQPNGRALIVQLGQAYPNSDIEGEDKDFKTGLNKLEWQLDGAEQNTLEALFGTSGY